MSQNIHPIYTYCKNYGRIHILYEAASHTSDLLSNRGVQGFHDLALQEEHARRHLYPSLYFLPHSQRAFGRFCFPPHPLRK